MAIFNAIMRLSCDCNIINIAMITGSTRNCDGPNVTHFIVSFTKKDEKYGLSHVKSQFCVESVSSGTSVKNAGSIPSNSSYIRECMREKCHVWSIAINYSQGCGTLSIDSVPTFKIYF